MSVSHHCAKKKTLSLSICRKAKKEEKCVRTLITCARYLTHYDDGFALINVLFSFIPLANLNNRRQRCAIKNIKSLYQFAYISPFCDGLGARSGVGRVFDE